MIESLVVSRELAERLKATGFPQTTEFAWASHKIPQSEDYGAWVVQRVSDGAKCCLWLAAPTLSELLAELPLQTRILKMEAEFGYSCYIGSAQRVDPNPANAAALLWLNENKEK